MDITRLFGRLIMLLAALAPQVARADAASFAYLAFGDVRGHIEPCGCDPATDMGGLRRMAYRIERERLTTPGLMLLMLGNGLPPTGEPSLKVPFLVEGFAGLKPTAYLINETEMERATDMRAAKGLPFVLSNAKASAFPKGLVAERIDAPDAVILGYASTPAMKTVADPYSAALGKRWEKTLTSATDKQKVLLFSGPDTDLEQIVRAKLFDVIISSNTQPLDALPGTAEKDDETKLERRAAGTTVYMTPLGGQGLLRGGKLMFEESRDLSSLLNDKAKAPDGDKPLFGKARIVTWLGPASGGGDEQLKDLFTRYNAAAKAAFADAGAARKKQLATTTFASFAPCVGCHAAAVDVWKGSAHAHAMATLQAKSKHEDAECVACHSVGAKAPGGFVSLADSPQFANVQCENCHGPRLEHTKNPKVRVAGIPAAKDMCVGCHNAQHSPKFNFKTYWPKIQHR